jgi:hypothetical protein
MVVAIGESWSTSPAIRVYAAGARRFARILIAQAEGWVDTDGTPTVEDVAAHWDEINDETHHAVPADLMAWSAYFLSHLA